MPPTSPAALKSQARELIRAEESAARLVRLNDDIVRSIASGLITVDDDGRILGVNRAATEILRDRAGTLLGMPLSNVLPDYATQPLGQTAETRRGDRKTC